MNKKLYALIALFSLVAVFVSCGDDDDEATAELIAWKAHQDQIFRDSVNTGRFSELKSNTGNGSVYYRKSNEIGTKLIEITDTPPLFTDSVVCRYTGWYYNSKNERVTFDTTEGSSNAQGGRGFSLAGYVNNSGTRIGGVIDGWVDILQIMHINDEYLVCLPQQLAYGYNGSYDSNNKVYVVPQYTTLFFNIKLLKIFRKQTTGDDGK